MNRELRALVKEHALRVRRWAEATNRRRQQPRSGDLNGWCAIASARLWRELSAAGIRSEIHLADGDYGSHVFLVVEDHVVDVTATQFNEYSRTEVLIVHQREADHHWFHQSCDIFETAEDLRRHQIITGWPVEQTAHPR